MDKRIFLPAHYTCTYGVSVMTASTLWSVSVGISAHSSELGDNSGQKLMLDERGLYTY